MKKNILKLNGVQELNKKEQLSVKGGTNERRSCGTHPDTHEPCYQTKLVNGGWGPCKTLSGLSCLTIAP